MREIWNKKVFKILFVGLKEEDNSKEDFKMVFECMLESFWRTTPSILKY